MTFYLQLQLTSLDRSRGDSYVVLLGTGQGNHQLAILHGLTQYEVVVFLLEKCQACDILVVARSKVDFCLSCEGAVLLTCPDGRHRLTLVDIAWQEIELQFAVFYLVTVNEVAEEHPAWIQLFQTRLIVIYIEVIHIREVA